MTATTNGGLNKKEMTNAMANQQYLQPTHRFKDCAKCLKNKPPKGGIQMNQSKWLCAQSMKFICSDCLPK
jgi:hypothetical protein